MSKKLSCVLVSLSAFVPGLLAQADVEVTPAVHHDVSPPLRELKVPPRSDVPRERPLRSVPHGQAASQRDPVVQTTAGPLVATAPGGLSFAGVGNGDYGFAPNAAPPDTNGAV